jgi:hypothetical protein
MFTGETASPFSWLLAWTLRTEHDVFRSNRIYNYRCVSMHYQRVRRYSHIDNDATIFIHSTSVGLLRLPPLACFNSELTSAAMNHFRHLVGLLEWRIGPLQGSCKEELKGGFDWTASPGDPTRATTDTDRPAYHWVSGSGMGFNARLNALKTPIRISNPN